MDREALEINIMRSRETLRSQIEPPLMVDIDGNLPTDARIKYAATHLDQESTIDIYRTAKGYHIYAHTADAIDGVRALLFMLELGADTLYIKKCLERQACAMFEIRRGDHNETYIYSLE